MLQTSENYNIIQEPTNKRKFARYFTIQIVRQNMPFTLWSVQQATYRMSVKTRPFNIRLKNHRKDVKDLKAILADNHFQKSSHRFNNKLIIFTIIDRLTNTKIDKEILRKRLIQRENFR